MRSDKLGYNAPIEVYDHKYYRYAEDDYSIKNIPVTNHDVKVMNEAIALLREFKDFSLFKEMDGVLQRLEDSVYASQYNNRAIIHLDKNEQLKGLEHIDTLYQAILLKKVLTITYRSFKAKRESEIAIHPQLLKEFNNRWFLLAVNHKGQRLTTYALDRILSITTADSELTYLDLNINGDIYYKDIVGVTVSENVQPEEVIFRENTSNAPLCDYQTFSQISTDTQAG